MEGGAPTGAWLVVSRVCQAVGGPGKDSSAIPLLTGQSSGVGALESLHEQSGSGEC